MVSVMSSLYKSDIVGEGLKNTYENMDDVDKTGNMFSVGSDQNLNYQAPHTWPRALKLFYQKNFKTRKTLSGLKDDLGRINRGSS